MTARALAVNGMQVMLAQRFWARFVGLLGRPDLAPDAALLIAPCNNIHTFFMRFAIDVVFLDQNGTVLVIVAHLRPWRVAAARRAHTCLELAAGGAHRFGIVVGQRIPELATASIAR
jgi:uncharacterized membrane protein (UPF0127 family)